MLQNEFADNPRYAKYALQVHDLTLVQSGDRDFKGIAKVSMDGQTYDVDVEVIVDGSNIMWRTGPAALSFLAGKKIEEGLKPLRVEPTQRDAQTTATQRSNGLSPCVAEAIDAYRRERGEESVVSNDMLEEWEHQCAVGVAGQ